MTKARSVKPGDVEAARKLLEAALSGEVPRARKPTKTQGLEALRTQIEGLRAKLAGYKLPRHIFVVPSVGRGPNGKLDHGMLRQHAIELVHDKGQVAR